MDAIVAAAARRRALAEKIGNGIVVLTAAAGQHHPDAPYRQDSYFYYLTGCDEPHTAMILTAQDGKVQYEYFLCRPPDALAYRWEGNRLNPKSAKRQLGFAQTEEIARLPALLPDLAQSYEQLFYPLCGADSALDALIAGCVQKRRAGQRLSRRFPAQLIDITVLLDEMRLIKDDVEIELIRRACKVSVDGVMAAMRAAMSAKYEYEIEAEIIAVYRRSGGSHAFSPIVAGGQNACTLHYARNSARVRADKALLVDTGCRLHGYAGDITRTFPADGVWRSAFSDVYAVVLAAQKAALRAAKPGASLQALEKAAVRKLAAGLHALKLCRGSVEAIIDKKRYQRFYMHSIGHWLGLDVHDVGTAPAGSNPRRLEPGMVLTVEPGVYIAADDDIAPAFHNIGIRIEDDILITEQGHEVLTAAAAKTPQEIRAWMCAH